MHDCSYVCHWTHSCDINCKELYTFLCLLPSRSVQNCTFKNHNLLFLSIGSGRSAPLIGTFTKATTAFGTDYRSINCEEAIDRYCQWCFGAIPLMGNQHQSELHSIFPVMRALRTVTIEEGTIYMYIRRHARWIWRKWRIDITLWFA